MVDNAEDAMYMAEDALNLYLDKTGEKFDREIASPSSIIEIQKKYPGEIVMLIGANPDEYFKKNHSKAIKKTLTIPEWLNIKAVKANINFSNVLQNALIELLDNDYRKDGN